MTKKLNEHAAYFSCSFGAFQIMGFHFINLGYKTVQEFVTSMQESERNHLLAYLILRKEPTLNVESLKRQNDSLMTEATKRDSLIAARLASIDSLEKVKPIILKEFITGTLYVSNVQDSLVVRNFIRQQLQRLGPARFE